MHLLSAARIEHHELSPHVAFAGRKGHSQRPFPEPRDEGVVGSVGIQDDEVLGHRLGDEHERLLYSIALHTRKRNVGPRLRSNLEPPEVGTSR